MMKNRLLLIFICFLFSHLSFAQNKTTTIQGKAPEYAGYSIDLYQIIDPFSEEKETVTKIKIEEDGTFTSTLDIQEVTFCEADFDAWHAQVYLEPGKVYNLVFPPINKVSDVQKRNPFFNPEVIYFGLKNAFESDINRKIESFDQSFSENEYQFFNKIYYSKSSSAVDSLKAIMNNLFPTSNNVYFEEYKLYKLAAVEYALHQGKAENFIKTYFVDKTPNLHIKPCQQLFEQLFTNYFSHTGNSIGGSDFNRLVGTADLEGMESYFITNNGWNTNLSRLVILSSINDAYNQGQYSKRSLIALLDKISESNWETSKKRIADSLKQTLTYLEEETEAPQITFSDFNGESHSLSEFKGEYVYLHFTSVANPICRQHLDYIKTISTELQNQVIFILLIPESEFSMKNQIEGQNWAGNFYTISEREMDKYKIQTFPSSYLISKEGNLLFSQAPNPMDGFANKFTSYLRQQHLEELRNQAK